MGACYVMNPRFLLAAACASYALAAPATNVTIGPLSLRLGPSQTILFLATTDNEDGFAFTNGDNAIGEATIRARPAKGSKGNWSQWSWQTSPKLKVQPTAVGGAVFAAAKLSLFATPTHTHAQVPFELRRQWETGPGNLSFVMRFIVTNNGTEDVSGFFCQ